MKIRILLLLFVALFALHFASLAQSDINKYKASLEKLDALFQKAIVDWNVPGMAIAIVSDSAELLVKGYGIREVGKTEKVDEHTLFAIASNTKAFTAAALATLVDEKKINWDDKVVTYIKDFQLYNPYVSQEMTIRDLLCHRSGLATFSGDLLWYGST